SPTAPGVTHRWTNLKALVDEVSEARIWAGFHYRFSTQVGTEMGRKIGEYTVMTVMRQHSSALGDLAPGLGCLGPCVSHPEVLHKITPAVRPSFQFALSTGRSASSRMCRSTRALFSSTTQFTNGSQ